MSKTLIEMLSEQSWKVCHLQLVMLLLVGQQYFQVRIGIFALYFYTLYVLLLMVIYSFISEQQLQKILQEHHPIFLLTIYLSRSKESFQQQQQQQQQQQYITTFCMFQKSVQYESKPLPEQMVVTT